MSSIYIIDAKVGNLFGDWMEWLGLLKEISGDYDSYELIVYDRWGQVVHTSNDPSIGWNGGKTGSNYFAPDGVYLYEITLGSWSITKEVRVEKYKGHVTIIR